MPTSETRADASMTMPLSRTRSSTSISDARKMPRVFRHLVRNNYKRFDRNMWLRICRNYARGAHCQHYNQLVRAPKARLRQNTKWRRSRWPRPMFLPASPFRMVLPPPLVLRRGQHSAHDQSAFASCVPARVLASNAYRSSLREPAQLHRRGLRDACAAASVGRRVHEHGVTSSQAPAGMTRSEPKCESQGAPPVGRSVRQSSGHRSGELQRPREPVLRSHAELERIRLPRRDGGRTVEEREQGQRSDRVRRTDAPTEGVAEVCARRVADERI